MQSLVVCNRHDVVTKQVIDQFVSLWQCKQFAVFVRPPTSVNVTQSQDDASNSDDNQLKRAKPIDTNYLFSSVLSPVYLFAQQNRPAASFDKLAILLTQLIKCGLMNVAFLNEQSMKLLHMKWHQVLDWTNNVLFELKLNLSFCYCRIHWKISPGRFKM